MGRRISRNWKPTVEMVEHRELLSLVTDIMAGNHNALINSPKVRALLDGVSNPVEPPRLPRQVDRSRPAQRSVVRVVSLRPRNRSPCPRTRAFFPPPAPVTTWFSSPRGLRHPPRSSASSSRPSIAGPTSSRPGCLQQSGDAGDHPGRGNQHHDAAQRHPDAAGRGHRSHARDHRGLGDLRPEHQFQHRSWVRPGDPPHQCRQPRQAQSRSRE